MKISVIGTGYVGLVTGTCFAEAGNEVICIDIDKDKVDRMKKGDIPIYEPGLEDMFKRNISEGRLHFSTKLEDVVGAKVIFLALPTPPREDGSADLTYVLDVASKLRSLLTSYCVIVDKSTVPVGTSKIVKSTIAEGAKFDFDVVSNPEFLREGQAVNDFMKPERVVIGTSSPRAEKIMRQLYLPFVRRSPSDRIIVTDEASAEMIKYAANAFLATKISFINQLSGLSEILGADIEMVRHGIGTDSRIGDQFLFPGPGYGGSCFPKDVSALINTSLSNGYDFGILNAVKSANNKQKSILVSKVKKYFGKDIKDKKIAIWGLAFKNNTDDVRESPAFDVVDGLIEAGAKLGVFDPEAMANFQKERPSSDNLKYSDGNYDVLDKADALVIITNWEEFYTPNFDELKKRLKKPVIFDGRNMYDLDEMKELGFYYESIGRKVVKPKTHV